MPETDGPIQLAYTWGEADYSAYREVMRLYWAQDGLPSAAAQPSTGLAYARYYLLPAIVIVAGISLWSWLNHRQWWPQTRYIGVDGSMDIILSGLFPSAAAVFVIALAGMGALSLLDQHLQDAPPDHQRKIFDDVAGFPHKVVIGPQGFEVTGPTMRGTYFWSVDKTGPLPVALYNDYVLVAHPQMLLAIPPRAMSIPPAELAGRAIAWRDAAVSRS